MSTGGVHEGLPEVALRDAQTKYERVNVRVQRRNGKGQLQSLWTGEKATSELWVLEVWLASLAGGGEYVIYTRDPSNLSEHVIPTFNLRVEGAPRPPAYLGTAPEAGDVTVSPFTSPFGASFSPPAAAPFAPMFAGNPQGLAAHAPPPPPWVSGLGADERGGYDSYARARYGMRAGALPPGATVASDELALKQLSDLKAENAKLAAKLEDLLGRHDQETARLRDELSAARVTAAAQKHDAEMLTLRAELSALAKARDVAPPKPALDAAAIAGLIAAAAPMITALIQTRNASAAEQSKLQFESMRTLMDATLNQANRESSTDKLLTTVLPMALPLLQNVLSHKDPEKQAALYEAMASNNLNSISMMAQLVEGFASATAGGEEKLWVGIVREALGGVVQMTERYMSTPGGLPGQPAAPQLPAQPVGHMTQAALYRTEPSAPPPRADTQRTVPAQVALMFRLLPQDFQSPQWRVVLEHLHYEPPVAPEEAADLLAAQLEHLLKTQTLPEQFAGFLDAPRNVLEALLERLPVAASRPQWASRVIDLTLTMLVEDNYLRPDLATSGVVVDGVPADDEEEDEDVIARPHIVDTTGHEVPFSIPRELVRAS